MTTFGKAARIVAVNLVVLGLIFAVLEGTASVAFVGAEILRTPGVPERHHVEHDALLGWVNRPNVHLPDMYGPGVGLRTNSQRFRSGRDFAREVPAGKTRIVCSGDSFTLGFGVGDDQTWCQRLTALDPRLETVNMGQGGYGLDQAYLWYMRDGVTLDHHLQLFAFLTDDFDRMRSDRFMGYGRPYLVVRGDSLVVSNRPVPRTSSFARWRALHGETVGRLNVVRLFRRLFRLDASTGDAERAKLEDQRLREIVAHMFADLRRTNDAKHSRLVLVYLPGTWDAKPNPETDAWRGVVRDEAARQNIPLVDLVEDIRPLPAGEVDRLYAPNAHFSVAGNEWAAGVLLRHLAPLLQAARAGAAADSGQSR